MKYLVSFITHETSSYNEIILFFPVHTSAKKILRLCKVSEGACLYYFNTVIVLPSITDQNVERPFLRDNVFLVVDIKAAK